MPVTRPTNLPTRRGEADAQNHKQRVRKQLVKRLKEQIGEQDIITGEGKVRIPVKGTKRYRFIFDRGPKGNGPGSGPAGTQPGEEMYEVWLDMEEVEAMLFQELDLPRLKPKKLSETDTTDYRFDTHAVKGPQIDKKTTIRRNMVRNSIQKKETYIGDFEKDDLRYISYRDKPAPKSKAVVFLLMDVSGSMGTDEKRIARLFFYWIVKFLRHRYNMVDIRFIAHTAEAQEVNEHQFFNRVESGGTIVSSAYKLADEMQQRYYPENEWNIYVLHASDGDNWQLDNEEVFSLIKKIGRVASLIGYIEIRTHSNAVWGGIKWSTLMDDLGERKAELGEEFMYTRVKGDEDIWPAIKHFFKKEDVESYT
jgi:uncharacterized sporulation protein YeaH/YhbH (DUF444 family)